MAEEGNRDLAGLGWQEGSLEKAPEGRHQDMNIKAQRSGPGKGTARERYLDVVVKLSIGYCGWSRREEGGRAQVLCAVGSPRAMLLKLVSEDLGAAAAGVRHVIWDSVCRLSTF